MAAAVVIHFSAALAALPARDFVEQGLVERLGVSGVCVGYDFGFGRGRQGNADLLREYSGEHGFWLDVVPPVSVDGRVVSSRVIRGLLIQGRVEDAQQLLGRPYCLAGEVERGARRGQELGLPRRTLPCRVPDSWRMGCTPGECWSAASSGTP